MKEYQEALLVNDYELYALIKTWGEGFFAPLKLHGIDVQTKVAYPNGARNLCIAVMTKADGKKLDLIKDKIKHLLDKVYEDTGAYPVESFAAAAVSGNERWFETWCCAEHDPWEDPNTLGYLPIYIAGPVISKYAGLDFAIQYSEKIGGTGLIVLSSRQGVERKYIRDDGGLTSYLSHIHQGRKDR